MRADDQMTIPCVTRDQLMVVIKQVDRSLMRIKPERCVRARVDLDRETARELFNLLGVWLHR